jgi:hypothetical protein
MSEDSRYEVERVLVTVTNHLSKEEGQQLTGRGVSLEELHKLCPFHMHWYAEGWVFYTADAFEVAKGSNDHDISDWLTLTTLLHYAEFMGFKWLRLDCDAVALKELPVYDW